MTTCSRGAPSHELIMFHESPRWTLTLGRHGFGFPLCQLSLTHKSACWTRSSVSGFPPLKKGGQGGFCDAAAAIGSPLSARPRRNVPTGLFPVIWRTRRGQSRKSPLIPLFQRGKRATTLWWTPERHPCRASRFAGKAKLEKGVRRICRPPTPPRRPRRRQHPVAAGLPGR